MVEMLQTLAKLIIILLFIGITLAVIFVIVWPLFGDQIQLFMCSFTAYIRSHMSQLLWSTISTILTIVIFVGTVIGLASSFQNLRGFLAYRKAMAWESCAEAAERSASVWVKTGAKMALKGITKYGWLGIMLVLIMVGLFQAFPLACPLLVDDYAGSFDNKVDKDTFLDYVSRGAATTWNTFLAGRGDPLFFKKPNPWPLIVLHYHVKDADITFEEIKDRIENETHVKYDENFVIIYNNDIVPAGDLKKYKLGNDGDIYFMFIDTYAEGFSTFAMENVVPTCNTPFLWFALHDTLVVCIVPE